MKKKLLITFLILLIAGCTTSPLKNNVLAIDRDGDAEIPGHTIFGIKKIKYTGKDKDIDTQRIIEKEYINSLLDELKEDNEKTIVIYIHGGLNWPSDSVKKANDLTSYIEQNGYKPIFINWRSGFLTTYKEHLFYDRQGEYLEIWGPVTSPFIFLEDLGRGLTRAPMRLFQIVNNYGKSLLFGVGGYGGENNAIELSRHFSKDYELEKQCDSDLKNDLGFGELPKICDLRSSLKKVKDGAGNLAFMGISLITSPLFDALATSSWSAMKRRTEIMFTKRICYDKHDECDHYRDSIEDYQTSREGIAAKFFTALKEEQKKNEKLKIILVGHSMGTIVANKILSGWPEINFSKIVYLAPASSIEDFKLNVLPYMKNHSETKFYNLMLHPIAENTEAQYWGIGQTGSLLTQIDNHYESPTHEGKRTLGRWVNVVNNISYISQDAHFDELKKRLYFRVMRIGGGYPEQHGDFDEANFIGKGMFWLGTLGDKDH